MLHQQVACLRGRSREGAWIEIAIRAKAIIVIHCRSREGAWIEIMPRRQNRFPLPVAPARERGLKSQPADKYLGNMCRSREGAWIEITAAFRAALRRMGRSREGAWIEMQ